MGAMRAIDADDKDGELRRKLIRGIDYSGYALYSTKYHMLCFTAYEHFTWHRLTIYGLLH